MRHIRDAIPGVMADLESRLAQGPDLEEIGRRAVAYQRAKRAAHDYLTNTDDFEPAHHARLVLAGRVANKGLHDGLKSFFEREERGHGNRHAGETSMQGRETP